jgi:hypothetical protein
MRGWQAAIPLELLALDSGPQIQEICLIAYYGLTQVRPSPLSILS